MITGIRSAILCDSVVTRPDGAVDLVGLWGEHVIADSKPGIVRLWLALTLDLDGQGTDGAVLVTAPNFNQSMPFQTPPGPHMTLAAFPILVPIIEESVLVVAVFDTRKPMTAFKATWATRFTADAKELKPGMAEEFIRDGVEGAALASSLTPPKRTRH